MEKGKGDNFQFALTVAIGRRGKGRRFGVVSRPVTSGAFRVEWQCVAGNEGRAVTRGRFLTP
jgi:hypothetical protein